MSKSVNKPGSAISELFLFRANLLNVACADIYHQKQNVTFKNPMFIVNPGDCRLQEFVGIELFFPQKSHSRDLFNTMQQYNLFILS